MAADVAVLFALAREAEPFRRAVRHRADVRVAVTGVGREAARRAAERVLADGTPRLLVMAGFAGALRHGWAVGDVLVASEVGDESGGRWPTQPPADGRPTVRLLTLDNIASEPAAKRRLGETHGADAVDMESSAVAAVCRERGVPFLAVRAVSDTVHRSLPAEFATFTPNGRVSLRRILAAVVRRPVLVRDLVRVARDTKLAARNLADALVRILAAA